MAIDLLSELAPGEVCFVCSEDLDKTVSRRLEEFGLYAGAKIQCACKAPSGSPIALWINGALIAIREIDCSKIRICRLNAS